MSGVPGADSLVLSGYGELVNYSQDSLGALAGTWPTDDTDFGQGGQPDVTTVARAIADGDIQSGARTGNATKTLVLAIVGTPSNVAATRDAVVAALNQTKFTLTWTPPGLNPVIYDCFRPADPITEKTTYVSAAPGGSPTWVKILTATFHTYPWTRSPVSVSIVSLTAAPTQVDAMDATTGWAATPAVWATLVMTRALATSTTRTQGSNSVSSTASGTIASSPTNQPAGYDANGVPQYEPSAGRPTLAWAKTFTAQDWSTTRIIGFPMYLPGQVSGSIVTVTLFDNTGKKWTWQAPYNDYYTSFANSFRQVMVNTAASGTGRGLNYATPGTPNLDFTHITGITVEAWPLTPVVFAPAGSAWSLTGYLDDLERYPTGSGTINGPASVVRYDGIKGVARVPASLAIVPAAAVGTLLLARSPGQQPSFNPLLSSPASGTTFADAGAFSGTAYRLNLTSDKVVYRAAASSFAGETYVVLARFRWDWTTVPSGAVGARITLTAQITGDTGYVQTITKDFALSEILAQGKTAYTILDFGELTLPPRGVPGQNTTTTVDITMSNGPAPNQTTSVAMYVDQLYLASAKADQLRVALPAGVTYSRFWVDAPAGAGDLPAVYGGSAADRSDAVDLYPFIVGDGTWNLDPGSNHVLIVMDKSAAGGTATLTYAPCGFAEIAA